LAGFSACRINIIFVARLVGFLFGLTVRIINPWERSASI
jgi:hypothetical protein